MNWTWLEDVGLVEAMNPYLIKMFMSDGVRVTCNAWRRLFQIKESVYKKLCLEFYATVQLRGGDDPFDTHSLTFCLGANIGNVAFPSLHGGWVSTIGQRL